MAEQQYTTVAAGTVALRGAVEALKKVVHQVGQDCEADAVRMDGMPFDGNTVAELIGAHLAMTAVLSHMVEQVADLVALLSQSVDLQQREIRNVDGRVCSLEGL